MRSRLGLVLSVGMLVFQVGTASAQSAAATSAPAPAAPVTAPAGRGKLDAVCAVSLARFCPALATTPGQTRNQVICLKPYRTSLPLACRSAVTATMR